MENITNNLLTLVSLEDKNAVRPPMERSALLPLINEAVDMASSAAQKKNITLDISCPPDLELPLYGSLLIQAMLNLLDNGIKYSGPGSVINISAFKINDGDINIGDINIGAENDTAFKGTVIEVRDRGEGIPGIHLDRIFERFYRVDPSRQRSSSRGSDGRETSTGLGLSIVRHIALLHGGSVEVESHAGEGSVFRLKIPG